MLAGGLDELLQRVVIVGFIRLAVFEPLQQLLARLLLFERLLGEFVTIVQPTALRARTGRGAVEDSPRSQHVLGSARDTSKLR
jgi:hypothetical protein